LEKVMAKRSAFRKVVAISVSALALSVSPVAEAKPKRTPEESIVSCRKDAWYFTEERILGSWAWLAGGHNTNELKGYISELEKTKNITDYSLSTADGRTLKGRLVRFSAGAPSTAVLIASGNLAIADFMLRRLETVLRAVQYDYYFIDYRGYGRSSDAIPSIHSFIQDFVAIGKDIRRRGYSRVVAYGPSLGGIVLVNAAAAGLRLDKLILDSVPSDLALYECDETLDPFRVVKASCPHVVALASEKDKEVPPGLQMKLLESIRDPSCGGHVTTLTSAIHVLNDKKGTPGDSERLTTIIGLLQEE
jgi:hypothetical protein